MVEADQFQHADPLRDGRTAELVPDVQRTLFPSGEVAQEGGSVVPPRARPDRPTIPLARHECREAAWFRRSSRKDSPSSKSRAVENGAGCHPEGGHGEGDFGLDSDDDRGRTPQPRHFGDVSQRSGPERVEYVERGDVDDDTSCAVLPDLVDHVLLESEQLVSSRAVWMEAIRKSPWRRIETNTPANSRSVVQPSSDRVTRKPSCRSASSIPPWRSPMVFILLRSTPMVTNVLGDLGGEAGDDHAGPHQTGGVDGLHEMVGNCGVDVGHAGDVNDNDLGPVCPMPASN